VARPRHRLRYRVPDDVVVLRVVRADVAADRLHQVEGDGLVVAHAAIDEPVLDVAERCDHAHLQTRLLLDLAQGGRLARLAAPGSAHMPGPRRPTSGTSTPRSVSR